MQQDLFPEETKKREEATHAPPIPAKQIEVSIDVLAQLISKTFQHNRAKDDEQQ